MLVLPHAAIAVVLMLFLFVAVYDTSRDFLPATTGAHEMPLARVVYLAADQNVAWLAAECARLAMVFGFRF